jgi:S-adenosylmethionine:diacylglycerol 3-amino-3-carboxypropyl transferase
MKTEIIAGRVTVPHTEYTVLLRTSGAGNVDMSIWLTDAEALQLASELRAAVAKAPESITTPEAA